MQTKNKRTFQEIDSESEINIIFKRLKNLECNYSENQNNNAIIIKNQNKIILNLKSKNTILNYSVIVSVIVLFITYATIIITLL